jgi:ATP-dependent RNA helicase DDX52/ROK1
LVSKLGNHQTGGPRAVVIAPTFELAEQIYRESLFFTFSQKDPLHIQTRFIHKFPSFKSNPKEYVQFWKSTDLLITTPMKFIEEIKALPEISQSLSTVKDIVLDEVDKYFEEGFGEQLTTLCDNFDIHKTKYYMFSATLPSRKPI